MTHTKLPPEELAVFNKLPKLKVIFDVGARSDTDYLDLRPDIELHAFEPNPMFFEQLREVVGDRKAYLNNFGLGDVIGKYQYVEGIQGFIGGESQPERGLVERADGYPIDTLDNYTQKHGIKKIDFLKVDTEGFDYRVLVGGKETLKVTRFVQYEHWNDKHQFAILLDNDFDREYIGYRNVLCMNKKLVPEKLRKEISAYIDVQGFAFLS